MTTFCWLLELPGPMYLHPARGDGVCGFTTDPFEAQRFDTKALAELAIIELGGALGALPVEHGFC